MHFTRMNCPKGYVQKSDLQKVISHEEPYPQNFFCTIHGLIPKSQTWQDRIQKKHWQVWKVVEPSTASFFLCDDISACWERKQPLLSSVIDQWIKKLWAQGLKYQRLDFEAYLNLEDDDEIVSQSSTLHRWISFKTSSLSVFWEEKSSHSLVLANILLLRVLRSHSTLYLSSYTLLSDLVWVLSKHKPFNLYIVTWSDNGLCELGEASIKYHSFG